MQRESLSAGDVRLRLLLHIASQLPQFTDFYRSTLYAVKCEVCVVTTVVMLVLSFHPSQSLSWNSKIIASIFTARCYAGEVYVYVVVACLSVRPSVCSSVTNRNSIKTAKHRIPQTTSTIAQDSGFLLRKISAKLQSIHPKGGAKHRWGRFKSTIFGQYLAMSQKRCKIET